MDWDIQQTIDRIVFLHPSSNWLPTCVCDWQDWFPTFITQLIIDMCVKHLSIIDSIKFIPRLWFYKRLWKLKIILGGNETVIKMITKRRSPMMRHVSKNQQRRASQVKYVDIKNELADYVVCSVINISGMFENMKFSRFSCSHYLLLQKLSIMSSCRRKFKTGGRRWVYGLISWKPLNIRQTFFSIRILPTSSKSATEFKICSREHLETRAGHRTVSGKHMETCATWCVTSFQGVPGNRCKIFKIIWKGQSCISNICKSFIIFMLTKSSSRQNLSLRLEESISSFSTELQWKFGVVQKHRLQRAKVDLGITIWNLERFFVDMEFHHLDEIDFVSRSSNHVDESHDTCPLRFSSVSGTNVFSFSSE